MSAGNWCLHQIWSAAASLARGWPGGQPELKFYQIYARRGVLPESAITCPAVRGKRSFSISTVRVDLRRPGSAARYLSVSRCNFNGVSENVETRKKLIALADCHDFGSLPTSATKRTLRPAARPANAFRKPSWAARTSRAAWWPSLCLSSGSNPSGSRSGLRVVGDAEIPGKPAPSARPHSTTAVPGGRCRPSWRASPPELFEVVHVAPTAASGRESTPC